MKIFVKGAIDMKLTDMLISAIIKRGILWEARGVDTEFVLPQTDDEGNPKEVIKIHLKAEHMTIRIEKD
jgi:hypothetical protein